MVSTQVFQRVSDMIGTHRGRKTVVPQNLRPNRVFGLLSVVGFQAPQKAQRCLVDRHDRRCVFVVRPETFAKRLYEELAVKIEDGYGESE